MIHVNLQQVKYFCYFLLFSINILIVVIDLRSFVQFNLLKLSSKGVVSNIQRVANTKFAL